jgi:hypothetical protein
MTRALVDPLVWDVQKPGMSQKPAVMFLIVEPLRLHALHTTYTTASRNDADAHATMFYICLAGGI